jgi:hypothetical protein
MASNLKALRHAKRTVFGIFLWHVQHRGLGTPQCGGLRNVTLFLGIIIESKEVRFEGN